MVPDISDDESTLATEAVVPNHTWHKDFLLPDITRNLSIDPLELPPGSLANFHLLPSPPDSIASARLVPSQTLAFDPYKAHK